MIRLSRKGGIYTVEPGGRSCPPGAQVMKYSREKQALDNVCEQLWGPVPKKNEREGRRMPNSWQCAIHCAQVMRRST